MMVFFLILLVDMVKMMVREIEVWKDTYGIGIWKCFWETDCIPELSFWNCVECSRTCNPEQFVVLAIVL